MTNFIDQEIADFSVNAYHDGDVTQVTKQDTLGKWGVYFFYPADFSFVFKDGVRNFCSIPITVYFSSSSGSSGTFSTYWYGAIIFFKISS